jgi:hypothetical protein
MTKKDFEVIASVLADAENLVTRYANDPDAELDPGTLLGYMVGQFSAVLKLQNPRFNVGTFDLAARPIFHERVKREILKDLGLKEEN